MPNEEYNRIPFAVNAKAIMKHVGKDGITSNELAERSEFNRTWGGTLLARMASKGLLVKEARVEPVNGVGKLMNRYYKPGTEPQLALPLGTRRERRKVKSWDELTPGEQEARVRSRQYYRDQQRAKGKTVKPRLGEDEGYRYGRQPGRPKSQRSQLLETSGRLAEAAAILFPNGLRTDEAFFAWVDLTRELMNG